MWCWRWRGGRFILGRRALCLVEVGEDVGGVGGIGRK